MSPSGHATPTNTTKSIINSEKPQPQQNHIIDKNLASLLTTATAAATTFLNNNDLTLLPSQSLSLQHLLSLLSPPPPLPPPPQCWFTRLLKSSTTTTDPHWPTFFRMSRHTFSHLLSLLSPSLSTSLPSIPPAFSLASALFRLAHNAPYHAVATRFGIASPDDACRAFFTVCKVVNEKLGSMVGFEGDKERVLMGFCESFGFVNCCGVLGFGRFGSTLVQALVDSQGRFLDLSAGWPCVLKPDFILCRTKLFSEVRDSKGLVDGPSFQLGDGNSIPQYVIGDACLPLLPWLLTPYNIGAQDGLSLSEKEFNSVHRNAMGMVSMAFRRVRERWKLLGKRWKEECFEYLPYVILMGCVLHNFLVKYNELVPDENMGFSLEMEEEEELPVFEGGLDESGKRIRDVVAEHLSQVKPRQ